MHFFRDAPDAVTTVRWYRCLPGARNLPYASIFGSRVWERDGDQPALGEELTYHPWRGGQSKNQPATGGICGTREQWENGASIGDPLPPVYPGTTIPICCAKPRPSDRGGIALGGIAATGFGEFAEGGIALGGMSRLGSTNYDQGGIALGGVDRLGAQIPFEGGIALGGQFVIGPGERAQGGIALGGLDAVNAPPMFKGGMATGGVDSVESDTGFTTVCSGAYLLPSSMSLYVAVSSLACSDWNQSGITLAHPGLNVPVLGLDADYSSDAFTIGGALVRFHFWCNATLTNFYGAFTSDDGIALYGGPQEIAGWLYPPFSWNVVGFAVTPVGTCSGGYLDLNGST